MSGLGGFGAIRQALSLAERVSADVEREMGRDSDCAREMRVAVDCLHEALRAYNAP